jgi:hypothetical protein
VKDMADTFILTKIKRKTVLFIKAFFKTENLMDTVNITILIRQKFRRGYLIRICILASISEN